LSGAITRPGTLGWGSGFLHGSFPGIHLIHSNEPARRMAELQPAEPISVDLGSVESLSV
jgi:hypothetical protein